MRLAELWSKVLGHDRRGARHDAVEPLHQHQAPGPCLGDGHAVARLVHPHGADVEHGAVLLVVGRVGLAQHLRRCFNITSHVMVSLYKQAYVHAHARMRVEQRQPGAHRQAAAVAAAAAAAARTLTLSPARTVPLMTRANASKREQSCGARQDTHGAGGHKHIHIISRQQLSHPRKRTWQNAPSAAHCRGRQAGLPAAAARTRMHRQARQAAAASTHMASCGHTYPPRLNPHYKPAPQTPAP